MTHTSTCGFCGSKLPKLESDHLWQRIFCGSVSWLVCFVVMEEQNSWLRRTKFSHTVYTRVDSRKVPVSSVGKDVVVPFAPLSKDVERKLQKFVSVGKSVSMPIHRDGEDTTTSLKHCASLPLIRSSLQLDKDKANKPKRSALEIPSSPPINSENCRAPRARSLVKSPSSMMLLSYLNKASSNQSSSPQKAPVPQLRPRSKSPLPSIAPSEVFREAKSSSQRFSSPPPQRRGSEKSIYGKSFARQMSDMGKSPETTVSGKHKSQKDNSWARKYSGGRRVSAVNPADDRRAQMVRMNQAVQTVVDWTLDPSKLLVGHRFASGAYSRLYRGVYDDKPVAIKFIRQPDDDDSGKMAAKLEKQYNSEINSLSHLYHKNVIKVTINMNMFWSAFCW